MGSADSAYCADWLPTILETRAIVVFKLTNPWHGLYFDTTTVTTPFRYIAIREQPVFWVVAGLAYVLSAAGFYMLIDVLEETRSTPRAAKAVVGLAAVPVIFDLVGYFSPSLILELNCESVGVGLFAIGALYVVREPFFAVSRYGRTQLIDTLEDAVVILDADDQVQDYNHAAIELFSNLTEGNGLGMEEISAIIDTRALSDGGTVELDRNGETRYFIIRTTPITVGETEIGRGVIFTDVTEIERQRRELQRKDDQLEGFATAITHELRNSVGIVSGQAELLSRIAAETDDSAIRSRTEKIVDEVSDMEEIVKQLRILAQYSQTISETEYVNLGDVARTAKRQSNVDDVDLEIEDSIVVEADQDRLRELFKQALLFAAQTGVSEVEVSGDTKSLRIKYDGRLLEDFDDDAIFAYGNAVPDSDSAMFLPNLQMIATSHGWELELAYENNKTVITIKTKNS